MLDAWGHDRVVLMGHWFGTDMASYFLLAHPERVPAPRSLGPSWIRGGKLTWQRSEFGAPASSRPGSMNSM